MFNMYEKAPCVCFTAAFPSARSASEEISRIVSSHLFDRFGAVKRGAFWCPRGRRIEMQFGKRSVWMVWYKSRRKDGEWILFVGPGDLPSLWDYLRGRKRVVYAEEFMVVSRDIHALLGSVTGISNVMWYFSEFRREGKKGVWTPDELPWTEP